GTYGRFVFLLVAVTDSDVVYQRAPRETPYGDRVVLAAEPEPAASRWWLLNTAAPGRFRAQETGPERFEPSEVYDARVIGAWQETPAGYALEVRVPLNLIGDTLAVGVIDVDRTGADYAADLAATWDSATGAPGRFIYQRPELLAQLGQFARAGGRFRVLDGDGWVLAAAGRVAPQATSGESSSLAARFF